MQLVRVSIVPPFKIFLLYFFLNKPFTQSSPGHSLDFMFFSLLFHQLVSSGNLPLFHSGPGEVFDFIKSIPLFQHNNPFYFPFKIPGSLPFFHSSPGEITDIVSFSLLFQ